MKTMKTYLHLPLVLYFVLAFGCSAATGVLSSPINSGASGTTPEDHSNSDVVSSKAPNDGPQTPPTAPNVITPNTSGETNGQDAQYRMGAQVAVTGGVGVSNEGHVNSYKSLIIPTVKFEGVVTDLYEVSDGTHCFKDKSIGTQIFPQDPKPKFKVETWSNETGQYEVTTLLPYNANAELGWDNEQGWYPMNSCGQSLTEFWNPMYVGGDIDFETGTLTKYCGRKMRITANYDFQKIHYSVVREFDCKEIDVPNYPKPIILELQPPTPTAYMLKK